MKNIATNSIGYTGIVTLSQCINGKKYKIKQVYNSGGNPLFNFFSDCLLGDYDIAEYNRPIKIMLLNKEEGQPLKKAANSSFIYITTCPEKVYNPNAGITRYSFIIPKDILMGTNFNAIGLYTKSATETTLDDYAAICDLSSSEFEVTMATSTVLVLDWQLIISNKETDSSKIK
jgi:hypothetical protein